MVLPALPIQYADYALWQRSWMEAGEKERQLAYWTGLLGGEQPVLELPFDRPRPARQSHRGAQLGFELPRELVEAVRALAQREGASSFMLLLASFQALLYRYSGQADIRVGVPIANRNRVETERLIGFFDQIINSESVPGADVNSGIVNPIRAFAQVIGEPRLDDSSATAWYMAAKKGSDTIEVAYLDGVDTPYLEQQEGFTVDGVASKVRIDAGVAPLDFRGLQKSNGA